MERPHFTTLDVYLSSRCQQCLVQSVKERLTRGVCVQWCRLFVENPSVMFKQRRSVVGIGTYSRKMVVPGIVMFSVDIMPWETDSRLLTH